MKIELNIKQLQEISLFIATPMYGGMCYGDYCASLNSFISRASISGIKVQPFFVSNESLIPRARNYCVDEFLRSDCTHLLFIDSDITFDDKDILTMMSLIEGHPDVNDGLPLDVLCGPYPKKSIAWEKVKRAVLMGAPNSDLQKYIGDYVINFAEENDTVPIDKPIEILEGGTGYMMIRRPTLERFMKAYPHLKHTPDNTRDESFSGNRDIYAFFDSVIDNKNQFIEQELQLFFKNTKKKDHTRDNIMKFVRDRTNGYFKKGKYTNRYLSEDYAFCQWVRNLDMKIWLLPWLRTSHTGTYRYTSSVYDLASINAPITHDPQFDGSIIENGER